MWPGRWGGFSRKERILTNALALVLGGLILGIMAADLLFFGWDLHVFLGRKLLDLIDYIAFWR